MRTFLRTTTALAAGLSLLAPTALSAQTAAQNAPRDQQIACAEGKVPLSQAVQGLPEDAINRLRDRLRDRLVAAGRLGPDDALPGRIMSRCVDPARIQRLARSGPDEAGTGTPGAAEAEVQAEAGTQPETAAPDEAAAAVAAQPDTGKAAADEAAAAAAQDQPPAEPQPRPQPDRQPEAAQAQPEATGQPEAVEAEAQTGAAAPQQPSAEAARARGEAPTAEPAAPAAAKKPAQAAAAAAPPAAAQEGAQAAEVETEAVTEATARSSAEEFAAPAPASGEAPAKDGRRGLSNLERALLVGAGAAAVGTILRGNREVVSTAPDRIVVEQPDGTYEVLKDDDVLLRRPGTEVRTERFADGSSRTTVLRPNGSKIVTVRDPELRVVRRVRITPRGERIVLIDDTAPAEPVDVAALPAPAPARTTVDVETATEDALRAALQAQRDYDRRFSLAQIRDIPEVRALAPAVELDNITFATGSAAIEPSQAEELAALGTLISDMVAENPQEIFLVEGHTDAVGSASANLALSDRRAESVALALTEYFDVPPENLVVQGYGEAFLKVPTEAAERANRRATVRRITPLLQTAGLQ